MASTRTASKTVKISKARKVGSRSSIASIALAREISTEVSHLPERDAASVLTIVKMLGAKAKPKSGQAFTPPEQILLEAIFAFKGFEELPKSATLTRGWRDQVLTGAFKTTEVMRILGLSSRESVKKRAVKKEVLAIKDGRDYYFPPWQFDDRTDNRVIEGLPAVLRAMSAPPIMIAAWLTRKNKNLEATPLDVLKAGRIDEVLAEAKGVGVS